MFKKSPTLVLVTVLVLALALAGCTKGFSKSPFPSEKSSDSAGAAVSFESEAAKSESSTSKAVSVKKERNGFDEEGASSLEVADVRFSIPVYFGEAEVRSDENRTYYYVGSRQSFDAMLYAQCISDSEIAEDDLDGQKQGVVDGLRSGSNGLFETINKQLDIEVAGMPGMIVYGSGGAQGFSGESAMMFFFNVGTKEIGAIGLLQSDQSEFDFMSDYDRIIKSATTAPADGAASKGSEVVAKVVAEAKAKAEAEAEAEAKAEAEEKAKAEAEAKAAAEAEEQAREQAANDLKSKVAGYEGRDLVTVCHELEEADVDFRLTHEVTGMDMTSSYEFGDFFEGDMVITQARVDSSGTVVLTIISGQAIAEAETQASTRKALESKFDSMDAWVAVSDYGKSQYPYGFKLHYIIGVLAEEAEDENTWFLKATCDVTNEYGAKAKGLNCEAEVTGTSENPRVIYFQVY